MKNRLCDLVAWTWILLWLSKGLYLIDFAFINHLHERFSALLHLFERPHVPGDVSHGYRVVLGEEEEVQQEENDGGGDEGQEVDVDPHAESLSPEEVKSAGMRSYFRIITPQIISIDLE